MKNLNLISIQVGCSLLGLACMLLAGLTAYDWLSNATGGATWNVGAAALFGVAAGGAFTYALIKIIVGIIGR